MIEIKVTGFFIKSILFYKVHLILINKRGGVVINEEEK